MLALLGTVSNMRLLCVHLQSTAPLSVSLHRLCIAHTVRLRSSPYTHIHAHTTSCATHTHMHGNLNTKIPHSATQNIVMLHVQPALVVHCMQPPPPATTCQTHATRTVLLLGVCVLVGVEECTPIQHTCVWVNPTTVTQSPHATGPVQ